MNVTRLSEVFQETAGRWRGCGWTTCFGRHGLNLEGLRASQARLMARATTGLEAADWRAAAAWLTKLELDAAEAEAHAGRAVELARLGLAEEALEYAEKACELEARYRTGGVWRGLLCAVAAEVCTAGARLSWKYKAGGGQADAEEGAAGGGGGGGARLGGDDGDLEPAVAPTG